MVRQDKKERRGKKRERKKYYMQTTCKHGGSDMNCRAKSIIDSLTHSLQLTLTHTCSQACRQSLSHPLSSSRSSSLSHLMIQLQDNQLEPLRRGCREPGCRDAGREFPRHGPGNRRQPGRSRRPDLRRTPGGTGGATQRATPAAQGSQVVAETGAHVPRTGMPGQEQSQEEPTL